MRRLSTSAFAGIRGWTVARAAAIPHRPMATDTARGWSAAGTSSHTTTARVSPTRKERACAEFVAPHARAGGERASRPSHQSLDSIYAYIHVPPGSLDGGRPGG